MSEANLSWIRVKRVKLMFGHHQLSREDAIAERLELEEQEQEIIEDMREPRRSRELLDLQKSLEREAYLREQPEVKR